MLYEVITFPGNVRELESMIFDAVSSHKSGKLSMELLKAHISKAHPFTRTDVEDTVSEKHSLIGFSDQLPTRITSYNVCYTKLLRNWVT